MTEFMSVQVRETEVRVMPSFLGKTLIKVRYGQQVAVRKEGESWCDVTFKGRRGWMHKAALTTKKIILEDSAPAEVDASEDEITLAGKGFNKQVEDEYRERHGNDGFEWVDKAEKYKVTQVEILEFLSSGDLQPRGGTTT